MQHRGSKRWSLWAPWDLIDADGTHVAAHTRFEGVAHAGDVMYYPPAWFHGTVVDEGDESITAAVDLVGVPSFGNLANESLRSPFGYGSCAAGAHGWHAQSREWDRVLGVGDDVCADN